MKKPNETLREFHERTAKISDLGVIEYRDNWREGVVSALALKEQITVTDVKDLDRGGRFQVATLHFASCDDDCRSYLVNDEHHFVRSAAALRLSKQIEG